MKRSAGLLSTIPLGLCNAAFGQQFAGQNITMIVNLMVNFLPRYIDAMQ